MAPAPDPKRWWALAVIALAQLMVILDGTIVNIALPSAQRALGMSDADRQWVITAYTLAFGGLLLLGGRIADLVGRKRTFVIGLAGFAVASALGGAAAGPGMLFAARALQGAFAAVLAPSALSLLTTTFTDPKERARAFGVYGALAGGGSAVGLIVGGVLTEYLNWRWSLYVNVPIALAALLGAPAFLSDRSGRRGGRLDVPGALLGCGGLVALVYGFSEAEPRGWTSPSVLTLFAAGVILLVVFVWWQSHAASPLLPLHILKDRVRAGSFATMGLATVGMFGVFLFLTYYLQVVLGYPPVRTGLAFVPMSVGIVIGATQIAARLLPRTAPRTLMSSGMLLAAVGMVLLSRLTVHARYVPHVLPALLLLGLGMGLTFMPVYATATAGVPAEDAGVASAALNTVQQMGASLGTVLLNTIATGATSRYVHSHPHDPDRNGLILNEGMVHGFSVADWCSAGVLLLAALVAGLAVRARTLQRAGRDAPA
ncbi:MFS transporter [Streptomyces rapamycinicus]|uniref:Puromycin resistance protein pur8 n=2 Tax=Streptomyces rapamycinicus TaxID=1226757 RepID=A0A0A0N7M4_STRRN|nr:MFS transporter [Streptomyces rapamycinicus]AGP51973.1 Puromycin resistance protein pur8 [Streptomyces rapamycinicus NRRL 5491]MBB4779393.1 EmrB/QacA subfamily drug resistance transporter [Streptomyces rapamycinicus]RLV75943.1 Puromycin resistance protein pur8 [Streptomyces rapamycinicus NRRL 5491]UTP28170.1 MFS transporter [Streptomyces rapamycinicus NRRL 5491]